MLHGKDRNFLHPLKLLWFSKSFLVCQKTTHYPTLSSSLPGNVETKRSKQETEDLTFKRSSLHQSKSKWVSLKNKSENTEKDYSAKFSYYVDDGGRLTSRFFSSSIRMSLLLSSSSIISFSIIFFASSTRRRTSASISSLRFSSSSSTLLFTRISILFAVCSSINFCSVSLCRLKKKTKANVKKRKKRRFWMRKLATYPAGYWMSFKWISICVCVR